MLVGLLATVIGAVIGVVGGYFFGVARSRNERRDNALAEVSKEMMLFYRGVVSWTAPNETRGPFTDPDAGWQDSCRGQYEKFIDALYGNEIWLGKATKDMIQEFAEAGRIFLNGVDKRGRFMQDDTSAWAWRDENLSPKLEKVQDALRAEVEASRYILPWRIVVRKDDPNQDA